MSISVRKRLAVSAVALGASLLGGAFLHPMAASAATPVAPAATSCYGGAQNWRLSDAGALLGPFIGSGPNAPGWSRSDRRWAGPAPHGGSRARPTAT